MPTRTQIYDAITQHITFPMRVYYHFLKMLTTHRVIPKSWITSSFLSRLLWKLEELVLSFWYVFKNWWRVTWSRLSFYLQNWKTWWNMSDTNDNNWAIWYIVPCNGFCPSSSFFWIWWWLVDGYFFLLREIIGFTSSYTTHSNHS